LPHALGPDLLPAPTGAMRVGQEHLLALAAHPHPVEAQRPGAGSGEVAAFFRTDDPAIQILASAVSITSGVIGCVVTCAPNGRSASLMAFITTAGAAPVPDSPTPLAPSWDAEVGVSICATSMSGISAAIGTR